MAAQDPFETLFRGLASFDEGVLGKEIVAHQLFSQVVASPRLGRFQQLRALNLSGAGPLYAAVDPHDGRAVMIALRREFERSPVLRASGQARFARGVERAMRVRHPNMVMIHEQGIDACGAFVVMELVEGAPLDRWLGSRARTWVEILGVLEGAGEALAAAHAQGLVHGDFQRASVLVDRSTTARVLDFGRARALPRVVSRGRREARGHIAPELWRGEAVSPRSDIFAYCHVVLTALDGVAHLDVGRAPVGVVEALLRGLEPEGSSRWGEMRELLGALRG